MPERSVGMVANPRFAEPNNRVRVVGDNLLLDCTLNNTEAADRLVHHWTAVLKSISEMPCPSSRLACNSAITFLCKLWTINAAPAALVATPKPQY
ncbi:hypothetical protein QUA23_16895 [Microcoleus sp. Pol1C5]|uniref:hypothetical protein n=1 Tax=Microcoleus sp. POL1_C1 TaxID=2818870 RepID=UPI002FD24FBF